MRVRMKAAISGTRDGQRWPERGGELEVPDHEGAALCAAELAEPVAERAEPEKATPRRRAETRAKD